MHSHLIHSLTFSNVFTSFSFWHKETIEKIKIILQWGVSHHSSLQNIHHFVQWRVTCSVFLWYPLMNYYMRYNISPLHTNIFFMIFMPGSCNICIFIVWLAVRYPLVVLHSFYDFTFVVCEQEANSCGINKVWHHFKLSDTSSLRSLC